MLRRSAVFGSVLALLMATGHSVFAHPGHGVTPPDEAVHLLEPIHLVPVVLIGAGVAVFAWRRARRES
jgi:hypothetical protein